MPNRIYGQYRKPKGIAWYGIMPTISSGLSTVHERTRYSYDIDSLNVTSYELDVLGRVVGVDRAFETEIVLSTTQFGGEGDQFGGPGIQFSSSSGIIPQEISNEIFKLLIKSKISKNNGTATLDDISTALQLIVSQDTVRIVDNEDMTFSVSFGSTLTETERMVLIQLDVVSRPQGVGFLGFTEENQITQFGGQFGFGDERAQFGFLFI
ncbi:MAG: DUF2612 domain-containing protein [candidate division Zixibacteria bacterium]|nr:DUF2612 domain-containing protein [candidate division Zixibacteria bacterium]